MLIALREFTFAAIISCLKHIMQSNSTVSVQVERNVVILSLITDQRTISQGNKGTVSYLYLQVHI